MGGIIGAAAGTVMSRTLAACQTVLVFILISSRLAFGKHSGRLTKVFITVGSAGTGITLGTALGVQTGMQKLLQLNGSLGEELRYLEALRSQLRRRGTHEKGPFQGPAVEAERQRLAGTLLQQLMWIAFRVHSNDFRLSFFDFIGMFNKRVAG